MHINHALSRHLFYLILHVRAVLETTQNGTNLHHEDDGVESDHGHDEPVERLRDDKLPDAVLEREPVLGHVAARRTRVDRKVDALFLTGKSHTSDFDLDTAPAGQRSGM